MQHKELRAEHCELETSMLCTASQLLTLPQWNVPAKHPKKYLWVLKADKGHRSLTLCPHATTKFIWGFPSRRVCSPPAYVTNSSMPHSWARAAPACPKTPAQTSSHKAAASPGLLVCILAWRGEFAASQDLLPHLNLPSGSLDPLPP